MEDLEDLVAEYVAEAIKRACLASGANPHVLAMSVPGLCHTHPPKRDLVPTCAFCRRRGNCFAAADPGPGSNAAADDLVAKWTSTIRDPERVARDLEAAVHGGSAPPAEVVEFLRAALKRAAASARDQRVADELLAASA